MNDIEPGVAYLEHHPKDGGPARRTAIEPLPFLIGRSESAHLRIDSNQVSREHATVARSHGELRLKDLGSTNGTFVNGQRIRDVRLEHGDIVHIATAEFTYSCGQKPKVKSVATQPVDPREARAAQLGSPPAVIRAVRRFHEMLVHRCVRILFQPIVELKNEEVMGYAAYGGGDHELSRSPADRYLLASESRLTDRLSQVSRLVAVEQAGRLPAGKRIFLSLHPSEFGHDSLIDSLCALESVVTSEHMLVVDVPEQAASGGEYMRRFREQLSGRGIAIAYAGFSAGRARLIELAEVLPEFIKLDKSMIRGIHQAKTRQKQVREAILACEDSGIQVVAVGVESEDEARECRNLGCHFGQGDWFAHPEPLTSLADAQPVLVHAHR
ncbi:MAG: EAL domain-containing protein [Pirellulales bacterium]